MLIRKHTDFTVSQKKDEHGCMVMYFHDSDNRCFYELMKEIDAIPSRVVVGSDSRGHVNFVTEGPLECFFAPHEGSSLHIFDSIDHDFEVNQDGMRLKMEGDELVRVDVRAGMRAKAQAKEEKEASLHARIEALEALLLNKE